MQLYFIVRRAHQVYSVSFTVCYCYAMGTVVKPSLLRLRILADTLIGFDAYVLSLIGLLIS